MQGIAFRHQLSAVLVALMALGLVAPLQALAQSAEEPLQVAPAMAPPAGKCGIRKNDILTFSGHATAGSALQNAALRQFGAGGALLETETVPVGGANPSLFISPEGELSGQRNPSHLHDDATSIRLFVTVTKDGASAADLSEPIIVDLHPPVITGARTISRQEIEVKFSEPVLNPDGDSPVDWTINNNPPSGVGGTGDTRTLNVTMANRWGEDANPGVLYDPEFTREQYRDCVSHTLGAAGRSQTAVDGIAPATPVINQIAERSAASGGVSASDTSPDVVVGTVTNGHTTTLWRESNHTEGLQDDDTEIASGKGQGGTVTLEQTTPFLSDGTYTYYVTTEDTTDDPNKPLNRSGVGSATYRLDRKAPELLSATADAQSVLVAFDDALVTGTDNTSHWKISLGETNYPITGISGEGNQRTLSATNVPDGATLSYNGNSGYADEAGNEAPAASVPVTSNFRDPSTMTLDVQPESQEHALGGTHAFDLRLTDHFGAPVQGLRLGGKVLTGPNASRDLDGNLFTGSGVIGTCLTNDAGRCSLSYQTQGAGTDTVLGWIDADNDAEADEVTGTPEPSNASGANDVRTHDTVEATTTGGTSPGPGPSPTPTTSPSPSPSPSTSPTPEPSPTTDPSPEPLRERSVTVEADDKIVDLGKPTHLRGAVASPGTCRSGAEVRVMRRIGSAVEQVDQAVTDAEGAWRASFTSTRNAAYHVEVSGGEACSPATSGEIVVKVRAAVDALVLDRRIDSGRCARVKGRVAPNKRGATVWLQQRTSRGWRSIDSDVLSSASRFSFPACFDRAGKKTLRVRWAADAANAASKSSALRVRVAR